MKMLKYCKIILEKVSFDKYIFSDNSEMWPTVKYIEIFGISTKNKEKTYEKIIVD